MGTTNKNMKDKTLIDYRHIIDDVFNNLAENFVEILNNAIVQEQAKTKYWKNKAWILANKNRLCFKHEKQEASDNFNDTGVNFEDYINKAVGCVDCDFKNNPK